MLHEIVGLADEPPARRRWFHDDYFDLFVWQAASGEITRFQLCYGIQSSERALVWYREGGFFHDGHSRADSIEDVVARFDQMALTLPKMVRQTVGARLDDFARGAQAVTTRRSTFRRASWQKRLAATERKAG